MKASVSRQSYPLNALLYMKKKKTQRTTVTKEALGDNCYDHCSYVFLTLIVSRQIILITCFMPVKTRLGNNGGEFSY